MLVWINAKTMPLSGKTLLICVDLYVPALMQVIIMQYKKYRLNTLNHKIQQLNKNKPLVYEEYIHT